MEKMDITLQTLNEILGYLGTRPYQEVFQLIEKLQNEAKEFNMKKTAEENAKVEKVEAEPV